MERISRPGPPDLQQCRNLAGLGSVTRGTWIALPPRRGRRGHCGPVGGALQPTRIPRRPFEYPDLGQRQLFRIRLGIAKPGRRRTGRLNERRDDARPGRRERIGRIPAEDPNLPGGRVHHPQKSRPQHGEIAGRARQPGRGRKHARGQESVAGPDQSAIEHLGPGRRPPGKRRDGAKPDPGVQPPCQPGSVRRGEATGAWRAHASITRLGQPRSSTPRAAGPVGDSRRTRAKRFQPSGRDRLATPAPASRCPLQNSGPPAGETSSSATSEEGGRLPR